MEMMMSPNGGAAAFLEPMVLKPAQVKLATAVPATESPGTFSSDGSTASGTHDTCESSSSDECAAAKPQKATPPVCNGGCPEGAQTLLHIDEDAPTQWWQNLASTGVKDAIQADAARPRVFSLEEPETHMVH